MKFRGSGGSESTPVDWFELADAIELFGLLFGALHVTGFIRVLADDLPLIIMNICCSSETRIAGVGFKILVSQRL